MPQADAAGARALGARAGPRRARRRDWLGAAYFIGMGCRPGGAAGEPAAVAAHQRPARRSPGQRHAASAGRRNPACGSRGPRPGSPAGARPDPGDRSGDRSVADRRRDLPRAGAVHARGPRHHLDHADLRVVVDGTRPRHPGAGARGGRRAGRAGADPGRCGRTRPHRAGVARGVAAVSARGRNAARAYPRHRGGRLPGRGQNHCPGELLRDAPRPRAVGGPAAFRSGPLSPGTIEGAQPLAVPAVRRRTTLMHRRSLRDAGGHARAGHDHPLGRDRIARLGLPAGNAVHGGRCGTHPARVLDIRASEAVSRSALLATI